MLLLVLSLACTGARKAEPPAPEPVEATAPADVAPASVEAPAPADDAEACFQACLTARQADAVAPEVIEAGCAKACPGARPEADDPFAPAELSPAGPGSP